MFTRFKNSDQWSFVFDTFLAAVIAIMFVAALGGMMCLSSGCLSTGAAYATGEEVVGSAYATAKLSAIDPSPAGTAAQKTAVASLNRLATDLPLFAAGKLTFEELGALKESLQLDSSALSSQSKAVDQINVLLNILSQNATAASGGLVTPQQAVAQQVVADVTLGIATAIKYQTGRWSVTNPAAWSVPTS